MLLLLIIIIQIIDYLLMILQISKLYVQIDKISWNMNDMHWMNQLKENINNNKDIKHGNMKIILDVISYYIDYLLMILQVTILYVRSNW